MAIGDKLYIADKPTLDQVSADVTDIKSTVSDINSKQESSHVEGVDLTTTLLCPIYTTGQKAVIYRDEIHILYNDNHFKFNGNTWVSASTMSAAISSGVVIVYRDEIHIIGAGGNLNAHYKWDGSTWTLVGILPITVNYSSAVVYRGAIHLIGGSNSPKSHYRFDGNSWTLVTSSMPHGAFHSASAVVYDDNIYTLGSGNTADANKVFRYNGTSWALLSELPASSFDNSAVVIGDTIHLFGDERHSVYSNRSWSVFPTPPTTLKGASAVVYCGGIHLIGGSSRIHYRYDPEDGWSRSFNYGKRYYLQSGTKILCNPDKTVITSGVTREDAGYTVTNTGYINIIHNSEEGMCYTIV